VYISPTWGDVPQEPIATTFGNYLYLADVINRTQFGVDWYSSSAEVYNLPFPTGTITGTYHCSATALARDEHENPFKLIVKETEGHRFPLKYVFFTCLSANCLNTHYSTDLRRLQFASSFPHSKKFDSVLHQVSSRADRQHLVVVVAARGKH